MGTLTLQEAIKNQSELLIAQSAEYEDAKRDWEHARNKEITTRTRVSNAKEKLDASKTEMNALLDKLVR